MTGSDAATGPAQIPLLRNLREADLAHVTGLLHRRTFASGISLMQAGERAESVFLVVAGSFKVHIPQSDGSDAILAVLGPGELIGEISVLDSLGRSASATTLEESTVLAMSRSSFWACLESMPAMSYNLVLLLCRRLRLANAHAQCLATLDVSGRVALQLLSLAREYGSDEEDGSTIIPIRLTQAELASLIGASRVRVNQVVVTYKRLGYVSVDERQHWRIRDATRLAQYLPKQQALRALER
jgi:CRP/FNR family cyclic AMP-dependent transcriptional regulator